MPLEDLRNQGVLLPEEEWGEHRLETTVSQTPVLILFLIAVASWAAAYLGGGHLLTWIGVVMLLVSFFGIIFLCNRAVRKQRKRFEREREDASPDAGPHAENDATGHEAAR